MKFNHDRLRGRIVEKFGNQAAFARHINKHASWLSNRINNRVHFDEADVYMLCLPENLDIAPDSIPAYFFTV